MIINSSPLIIFGKLDKVDLLKKVLGELIICEKGYEEVVVNGKKIDSSESFIIEDAIIKGLIKIKKLESKWKEKADFLQRAYTNLDEGEAETIALVLQEKQKEVLIDERTARKVAELNGIRAIGSLRILLIGYKSQMINEQDIREIINKMTFEKFRVSASVINRFWTLFEKIKKKK